MTKFTHAMLWAGVSLAAMVPGVAFAQDAVPAPQNDAAQSSAADSRADPNAIIVTARRREERLQDVPISITAFNQQQLDNRNIVSAIDLAQYTPSLSVNSRFGNENASFAIRGFVQEGATSPSVGTYFAEVATPHLSSGTGAGNTMPPGTMFDLENVEVLKGPQGTLFGRNTTGGAVLIVPKKPTDRLEGYLEGTVGNFDLMRLQGVINVPLSDSIRVRLGGDRETRRGYLNNVDGIGPKDFADVNYYSLRGSIVIDVTPDIENYTIATYNHSNTHGSAIPHPFISYSNPGVAQQVATVNGFSDVSNNVPNPLEDIEQWQVINTTTWRATDTITLKNIVSYAQFRERQSASIYGDNGGYFTAAGFSLANPNFFTTNIVAVPGSYNAAESSFTEEFQIQGRTPNDRLNYQAGVYYENARPLDGFQNSYSGTFITCTDMANLQCGPTTGFISNSRSQYWFRDKALYAQATFKMTDQLSLTGGFRYTWDDSRGLGDSLKIFFPTANTPVYGCVQPSGVVPGGTSAAIAANPLLCSFTREQKSSAPTWLVDLDYKPIDNVMVYAKYARGYRQGGINVTSYGLETWKPEKVDLYEIGAKTNWGGSIPGHFNIAGFYNKFSNQLVAVGLLGCNAPAPTAQCPFNPASAQGFANAGRSTIKGVELDASIEPFHGLRIDGSYSYIDARINTITAPPLPVGFLAEFLVAAGGPIPLVPKNQFVVTGTYTLPLDESVGTVSVGLTYSHRDSTFGNTSSFAVDPITGKDVQILPPQNLLNLNVNWNDVGGMPFDLAFFVTNLTKQKFITYTTGKSFGFDSYIANEPRMWGVRAKVRFGRDEAPEPAPVAAPPPPPVEEAAPPPPPPPPPAKPAERG